MRVGDVLRTKKFRHQLDKKQWVELSDPKKEHVGVFVFLGTEPIEPKDGETIDIADVMAQMGWMPIGDHEK